MADTLHLELRKLGLKDKEVRTYLAGLELGPSSVQNIAKKAGIVRPTTYEIIKILQEKDLFAEIKEGKKRYFIAQSPEKILRILRLQRRELEEKEREFVRIIAALESKYSGGDTGGISVFKGEEGLNLLNEKLSFTSSPEIFVLSSVVNASEMSEREAIYQSIKKRLGKIEVKELYSKEIKSTFPYGERKIISPKHLMPGTLIVFDKAVFLPDQKQEGYLIENSLLVDLFKSLFLSLWG